MPLGPSDKLMRLLEETSILPPSEERKFREWAKKNNIRDVDNPQSHYDYRGFWKEGIAHREGEHFTDKFKQFGHPTFSVESKYARPGEGGMWIEDKFVPQLRMKRTGR